MTSDRRVFIALTRPPGYEDVHAELVVEDATYQNWSREVVRDEVFAVVVAIDRPEGYERASKTEVASEAVKASWPAWSILKNSRTSARPLDI